MFHHLVHNWPGAEIHGTLKMCNLKKSMVGSIEGILSDFELSDEGYVLAWDYVISQFKKRRSIAKAFF